MASGRHETCFLNMKYGKGKRMIKWKRESQVNNFKKIFFIIILDKK